MGDSYGCIGLFFLWGPRDLILSWQDLIGGGCGLGWTRAYVVHVKRNINFLIGVNGGNKNRQDASALLYNSFFFLKKIKKLL